MHPLLTKLFFSCPLPPERAHGAMFWKGTWAGQTSPSTWLIWRPCWGPSVEEASSRVVTTHARDPTLFPECGALLSRTLFTPRAWHLEDLSLGQRSFCKNGHTCELFPKDAISLQKRQNMAFICNFY